MESVDVPAFLPDRPENRSDMLDYAFEIEHLDAHLDRMLASLDQAGERANTLILVTSDNGMAFPRAKANCYEFGIHMPLAISWPNRIPASRTVDDLVGFVDLTATILDAASVLPDKLYGPSGRSIFDILESDQQGVLDSSRNVVCSARERHSSARYNNCTYPQRSLRTHDYLYIRNFKPDRWPAGDPKKYGIDGKLEPMHSAYHDIDASPSLSFLVEHRDGPEIRPFFLIAVDKRPAEELFNIHKDPACLTNLAGDPEHGENGIADMPMSDRAAKRFCLR